MLRSNQAPVPQLLSPSAAVAEACTPGACAPQRSPRTAAKSSPRPPQLEKAGAQWQRRPSAAKNTQIKSKNFLKKKKSGGSGLSWWSRDFGLIPGQGTKIPHARTGRETTKPELRASVELAHHNQRVQEAAMCADPVRRT